MGSTCIWECVSVSFHVVPRMSWGLIRDVPPSLRDSVLLFKLMDAYWTRWPSAVNPLVVTCVLLILHLCLVFNPSKFLFRAQRLTQIFGWFIELPCSLLFWHLYYQYMDKVNTTVVHPRLLFLDLSQVAVGNHTQLTGRSRQWVGQQISACPRTSRTRQWRLCHLVLLTMCYESINSHLRMDGCNHLQRGDSDRSVSCTSEYPRNRQYLCEALVGKLTVFCLF